MDATNKSKFLLEINFLKKLIALFILLCATLSCGKFVQSLYITNVENSKYNETNLKKIETLNSVGSSSFKIAVISDSHDYYSSLKKQIDYINAHASEISFVLHTGDATNLGLATEWEMLDLFMSELKMPYILVIGNHDMLTNGEEIFKQMYGEELDFSFIFKQTKFVVFNNNNWESDGNAPDFNFLESELSSSTSTHLIVLGHVQPDDSDRYSNAEISRMKNIVSTNNVSYFLNGHNHNASAGEFGGAVRLTVGASSKGKLLLISITDGGITHEYVSP